MTSFVPVVIKSKAHSQKIITSRFNPGIQVSVPIKTGESAPLG